MLDLCRRVPLCVAAKCGSLLLVVSVTGIEAVL